MAGRSGVVRDWIMRSRVPIGLGVRLAALFFLIEALFLMTLALTSRPAAAQPVKAEVKAVVENGFARFVFTLAEDIDSQVRLSNNILIITFKRAVDIKIDKLAESAPDLISAARRDPDGTAVRIALTQKVTMNSMAAAERLFIDLLPESWAGPPPGLPREVIEELARRAREAEKKLKEQRTAARQNKMPAIRVRVSQQPTFTRYTFDLPDQIGVTANNSKDRLTLTFDTLVKFDLADAKAALPPAVGSIDTELDHDTVAVRFTFANKVDVRTFREEASYVVDVTPVAGKSSRQDGSVRSDELPALAAQSSKPAPPPAVEPPQTVPARVAEVSADQKRAPAIPQSRSEKAADSDTPAPPPNPPATVPPQTATPPNPPATMPPQAAAEPVTPPDRPPVKPPAPAEAPAAKPAGAEPQAAPKPLPPAGTAQQVPASPAEPAQPAPAAPTRTSESATEKMPRDANAAVNVTLKTQGDNLSLLFPFASPTPAALFARADTLWLVFDTDATIGLAAFEGEPSRTIKSATLTRLDHLSIVRVKLERPRLMSASVDGPDWIVTVGSEVVEPTRALSITRNTLGTARASVTIPFEDPRQLHRLTDPDAGDTLMVVTALGPARSFVKTQSFVEFRALAATHGVVVQPLADDLNAELAVDKIVITRPPGLALSHVINGGQRAASIVYQPYVLDAQVWSADRKAEFAERKSELIRNASEAKDIKRLVARVELARFYLARGMALEAKAVLDVALSDNPPTAEDSTPIILRGAANILSGRPTQGLKDLANPFVGNQHDAPLWRALAYAREGRWTEAREGFRNVGMAMGTLPVEVQRLMLKEMVRSSIEVGDITGAVNQMHEFEAVGVPHEYEPALAVLGGRLAEGLGRVDDALRSFSAAADSWDRPAAAQGRLREIVLKRSLGTLSQADAIGELELLTTVWRGDETELEALALLARLYTEEGRYREAFNIMRTALMAHPNSETTRRIQDEAVETFDGLFLGGKADALPAIDALSMFYDFRELTPIGRRGDEMIRRLADRLVAVDLLDQAAELLQHQVDHRLQGAGRAQVATHLAVIYLMNRKPERALKTLRATRSAELSNELRNQRLLIEARALSDMGRHGVALEIVASVEVPEAVRLRSDILWAARRWREAAEQIELLYGERWREFEPLAPRERIDILRAAIGYALGEDSIGLLRFREKYAGKMGDGMERRAFDVVTAPIGTSGAEFRDIARTVASIDTLDAFLRDMRARFPESRPLPAAQPTETPPPASQSDKPKPDTTGTVAPRLPGKPATSPRASLARTAAR